MGGLAVSFLPAIVATVRRHRNRLAIVVLNVVASVVAFVPLLVFVLITPLPLLPIVLMLAGVPWFVAMVWACTNNAEARE